MKLRRYDAGELTRFLTALDQQLGHRAVIVLIGGSALALGHGVPAVTNDIDTYESSAHKLAAAAARARTHVGLAIPLGDSSIAQLPPGYEDRAFRALPALRFLEVWVAEAHDLAASKLLRGDEHDRQPGLPGDLG